MRPCAFPSQAIEQHKWRVGINATEDATWIERMAELQHKAWMQRNKHWAEPHQMAPYAELSDVEQEKDRAVVRAALSVFL